MTVIIDAAYDDDVDNSNDHDDNDNVDVIIIKLQNISDKSNKPLEIKFDCSICSET